MLTSAGFVCNKAKVDTKEANMATEDVGAVSRILGVLKGLFGALATRYSASRFAVKGVSSAWL